MPTNQIYEFATSSAAYVEALATYASDVERTAGQQSGVARAELNNRALRQANAVAAAIGTFMVTQGYDCLDDGDTATRASDFADAVAALIAPNITAAVNTAKLNVLQTVFPVGSIYTSYNISTSPATLLGFGSWTRIQGRMLIGASSAYPATSTGGSATHTLTTSEMPSHTHTASSASAGSHSHGASTSSAGAHTHSVSGTAASTGSHTHTITVASSGAHTHAASTASAGAHTHTRGTMEITGSIVANDTDGEILIAPDSLTQTGALYVSNKVTQQGPFSSGGGVAYQGIQFEASRSWSGATSSNGGHTHTVTVTSTNSAHSHTASNASAGAHTHSVSGTATSAGAHTHTVTINTNGAHTHTVTIGSTGSGTGFSTISPYLAVYMWRRTA